MRPRKIQRTSDAELTISWDDGHQSIYSLQQLRDHCPCATCNTERESRASMLPIYQEGKYILTGATQVGSYAVQLRWQDGHDTGIYTFELLRRLCPCEECATEQKF